MQFDRNLRPNRKDDIELLCLIVLSVVTVVFAMRGGLGWS